VRANRELAGFYRKQAGDSDLAGEEFQRAGHAAEKAGRFQEAGQDFKAAAGDFMEVSVLERQSGRDFDAFVFFEQAESDSGRAKDDLAKGSTF
jgi:hypothetical protein